MTTNNKRIPIEPSSSAPDFWSFAERWLDQHSQQVVNLVFCFLARRPEFLRVLGNMVDDARSQAASENSAQDRPGTLGDATKAAMARIKSRHGRGLVGQ